MMNDNLETDIINSGSGKAYGVEVMVKKTERNRDRMDKLYILQDTSENDTEDFRRKKSMVENIFPPTMINRMILSWLQMQGSQDDLTLHPILSTAPADQSHFRLPSTILTIRYHVYYSKRNNTGSPTI